MRLPRPVQEALNRVLSELHRISDAIQQHENAVRESKQTSDKQTAPQQAPVAIPQAVEIKKSTADSKQEGDHNFRMLWLQVALTLFTAGAFGAATYYACYAKKQWSTMNDTYGEIKQQTVAVQQAATNAGRSATAAENAVAYATASDRPWVGDAGADTAIHPADRFVNGEDGRGKFINIFHERIFKNAGKRPAYIQRIDTTNTYSTRDCTETPDYKSLPEGRNVILLPQYKILGKETHTYGTSHGLIMPGTTFRSEDAVPIPLENWNIVQNKEARLCLYYSIEYLDVSFPKVIHHTTGCEFYITTPTGSGFVACTNRYDHAD